MNNASVFISNLLRRGLIPGALLAAALLIGCRNQASMAYVDNGRLFRDVKIFMTLRDSVQAFNKGWQEEAKPLKDSVDSYMKAIGGMKGGISGAEREKVEKEFRARQEAFQKFAEANQKKAGELERNLTESALKKVNAILQRFRDEKGYAIILGTTAGGNILAADKSLDITDDVIIYVNAAGR